MKPRSGATRFEVLPPPPNSRRRFLADSHQEVTRIVRRLLAIMAFHAENASRMGTPLGATDLMKVVEALEAETQELPIAQHLDTADEVRTHLLHSLFEELLSEPSNVFLATAISSETTRYEAMPGEVWLQCLARLRQRLSPAAPIPS